MSGYVWSAAGTDIVKAPDRARRAVPRWVLAFRLAWRQLCAEPARLFAAITGVMFATVLVLMQLGFRGALFTTATALPEALQAELFLIHPMTMALFRAEPLPRVRGFLPAVTKVVPIYLAQTFWRNPVNGTHRAIQLIGFDAEDDVVKIAGLAPLAPALHQPDNVAFDSLTRPESGDIKGLLERSGTLKVQLGNHEAQVVGTVRLGASFGADGNVVMSEGTFAGCFPRRERAVHRCLRSD